MRRRLAIILAVICVAATAENALAGTTVKTWKNPSLKIDTLNKILVSGMTCGRGFRFSRRMSWKGISRNGLSKV